MKVNDDIEVALLRELYTNYPPILQIKTVAKILREDVPTIRARIRRGSFQVAVRQEPGGRQYVLLADLVRFLTSGEIQTQPSTRLTRATHNSASLNGSRPRGRPPKAVQLENRRSK